MQYEIFSYLTPEERQFSQIRTVEIDGEIWFVAADVTKILGYTNGRDDVLANCKLNGIKMDQIPIGERMVEVTLISEPNVYRLAARSSLPGADQFEAWIFEKVIPQIRKKGFYGKIDRRQQPNFISRYQDNYHKLPNDHFSVISEMYVRLFIELEKVGYQIPDKGVHGKQMMPDISVGQGFAKFLKEKNSDYYEKHLTYTHTFPDGREVEANMYHIDALPMFIRYIHEKWIPENAERYFRDKDPLALDYLPKLLEQAKNPALPRRKVRVQVK